MKYKYKLEALASFLIIGLGQILKGEGKKGLLLILIFYFTLPSLIYLTLLFNAQVFLLVLGISFIFGIMLWIYNILDALTHEAIV